MENEYKIGATLKGPEIQITCLSNVYVRRMFFREKGIVELGHRHPYSHASLVASGSVSVQVYDDENKKLLDPVVYKAPSMIMIEKDIAHQIESLEDETTVCCIHALRDETETIIDPEMIPLPSSLINTIETVKNQTGKMLRPPANPFDDLTAKRIPRMFNASGHF
jgi:quercetin dioxygenase-like cupin family protein